MGKFLPFLFFVVLTGCLETKHLRNLRQDPGPQGEKLTAADFVFSRVYERVLAKKCVGCHREGKVDSTGQPTPDRDNPGGVNLQTYENVKRKLNSIKSVVETGEMGFEVTPTLTNIEKILILGWIERGAPE